MFGKVTYLTVTLTERGHNVLLIVAWFSCVVYFVPLLSRC